MHRLAVIMLVLVLGGLPAALGAETRPPAAKPVAEASSGLPPVLALIGGGVIGVVLAAGVVNLGSAALMLVEGAGFAEALEAGASLPLPVAALSLVLGGLFGRDLFLPAKATAAPAPVAAPAAAKPAPRH